MIMTEHSLSLLSSKAFIAYHGVVSMDNDPSSYVKKEEESLRNEPKPNLL